MAKFPTPTASTSATLPPHFKGPAGPFSLSSPFSGNLAQIFLPQLELEAGQGKAKVT
jgi:hypothetical protein